MLWLEKPSKKPDFYREVGLFALSGIVVHGKIRNIKVKHIMTKRTRIKLAGQVA